MISVVVPAYNEEDGIADTLAEIRAVLEGLPDATPFEIIVVDDGSKDQTRQAAQEAGARVISHPHNVGYGHSLKDGIRQAKYDTIIITDADRTYPFTKVPELLAQYQRGFDMVVGARTGDHYRESFIKSPLRRILRFMVEFSAGRKIPDINSGLRVFSRKTALGYLSHLCDTFSFTTSMTLAYMMTGKFVDYVPIPYDKRAGKSKVKLLRDSMRTIQYIIQAITYYNPFKIFLLFWGVCIVCSMMGFLLSITLGLRSGFLLGVGGLLVSILVLCCGLLADLLKQIMNRTGPGD